MDRQEKYHAPFPSNLRTLLEEKGTTITALANELGISRQAVSQYADGTGQPNAEKLGRIADYFDVSTDWLLGRSGGVKALNPDKQSAGKYTGLSESVISWMHSIIDDPVRLETLNAILGNKTFQAILPDVHALKNVQIECEFLRWHGETVPTQKEGCGGYYVDAFEYLSVLEYRIAEYLKVVIDDVTLPSLDK